MKLVREFSKFLDARLLLVAAATVVLGFGIAHWNGLRVAADSSSELLSGSIGYELGFSQATTTVLLILIAVGLIVGVATIVTARVYTRLAVQILMTTVIFGALNLVILTLWSGGI